MTSNLEIEDVIERAGNFLTHQEGIEETSLSEVRQPRRLDGRRTKLDAEDYIVSRLVHRDAQQCCRDARFVYLST